MSNWCCYCGKRLFVTGWSKDIQCGDCYKQTATGHLDRMLRELVNGVLPDGQRMTKARCVRWERWIYTYLDLLDGESYAAVMRRYGWGHRGSVIGASRKIRSVLHPRMLRKVGIEGAPMAKNGLRFHEAEIDLS